MSIHSAIALAHGSERRCRAWRGDHCDWRRSATGVTGRLYRRTGRGGADRLSSQLRRLPPARLARPQRSAAARRPQLHERLGPEIRRASCSTSCRRRCRPAGPTCRPISTLAIVAYHPAVERRGRGDAGAARRRRRTDRIGRDRTAAPTSQRCGTGAGGGRGAQPPRAAAARAAAGRRRRRGRGGAAGQPGRAASRSPAR